MDINRFTEKAREALATADHLARRNGNPQLDVEHLLMALLNQEPGLAVSILRRCEVNVDGLKARLEQELGRLPRVSTPGGGPDQVSISGRLRRLLHKAEEKASPYRDGAISLDQPPLALPPAR